MSRDGRNGHRNFESGWTRIRLVPAHLSRVLSLVAAGLLAASVIGQFAKYRWGIERAGGLIPGFNVDQEANFPTWYASALLLAGAVLLALTAAAASRRADRSARSWWGLAVVFLGLSIDEGAGLHELLIIPLRESWHAGGALYYTWVVPGIAVVLAVAAASVPLLAGLPRQIRRRLVAAGCLYVGGAVGMELVSGAYASAVCKACLSYALLTTLEEGLEMFGAVLLIRTLLDYGALTRVRLEVGPPATGKLRQERRRTHVGQRGARAVQTVAPKSIIA
jgi:hypothetical protein